jgi:DNA-binding CsgD family transcriptional regulator
MTIIRSVACIGGRVYTGTFEEFGYWEPDDLGQLQYHSLTPLIIDDTLQNDEIWKIVSHGDYVYFQSFGKLLYYDHKNVRSIPVPGSLMFLLKCGERLFIQQIEGGLYEIINNQLTFIEGSNILSDTEVNAIVPLDDGRCVIGTSSKGLILYDGVTFSAWENEVSKQLIDSKINNGIRLSDMLVFGTILKGLYVFDLQGKLIHHIHTGSFLQNNTVLSLCSDADNNLWVGLDKGFDYIAFDTPLKTYIEAEASFGTVYTACLFKDYLYVGTNQGIYYFIMDSLGIFTEKKFLSGSQGQVWFIRGINGELYCGLNDGTYLIRNNELIPVSNVSGGYNLKQISTHGEELLLQSTYNELVVYRKHKNIWSQSHTLGGFEAPARFLEVDHLGNIWLGHTISGIYLIQPNHSFDSAALVLRLDQSRGLSKFVNRIFKVDNRIIVPTGEELLQWDAVKNQMVPYDELTPQLEGFESSTTILPVSANKYWFIKKNEIAMIEVRYGQANILYRLIPEMYGLELVEGYENIVMLNDSLHLICLENGFSILNLQRLNQFDELNEPPQIREVIFWKSPDKQKRFMPDKPVIKQLKHSHNNLTFMFTAPGQAGRKKFFQYMLRGMDKDWSEWTSFSEITYYRLPPGNYTFAVRTLSGKGIITSQSLVNVRIRPPWYLSYYAIASYIILLLAMFWLLRMNYLRRHWKSNEEEMKKERERLLLLKEQAENEVIRLTNEKLQSEIAVKNSQLANNTMSILRKNEILSEIQEELNQQREELGDRLPRKYYSRLNQLIENSFKSDHDWEMFENLFDQAHENFFQRLKSDYPDLTPSDLRLCAYLRLNLSSKEIAPLLNISVRGVEERRYRLRKRLQLPSEQNLTEFILAF